MRIQYIKINSWRHFEQIELRIPDNAPIICIVGGNGTGKSQILELIAACAQRIGLSPGSESSRGDPFSDQADFEIRFFISPGAVPGLDLEGHISLPNHPAEHWDRTLTISKGLSQPQKIVAGGFLTESDGIQIAALVVQTLTSSASIHYLSLDADRAYPKIQVPVHELGQAFERDWDTTSKQSSYRITRNLYEEWFRYLIGKENRDNNNHIQKIRLARDSGTAEPTFIDQFEPYKTSIKQVLPHLLFVGIDPTKREIKFDSTGIPLSFDQLSGGEREIAFLVGQIERFGLKKGLLLVDEPELHLNYDLLRNWIGFLKSSVEQGQIWLATHSLEVVEVTGKDATFLLERDAATRRVRSATSLSSQPVVSTLSRAVGSPAFSIANLSFVLIEGEEEIGERERFRLLCRVAPHVRFIESGSCKQVIQRKRGLEELAAASDQALRIGAVVDGDFRSTQDKQALSDQGLFVLSVHEIENFYLHPPTLRELTQSLGRDPNLIEDLIRTTADSRAGAYIFDAARTDKAFADYPPAPKATRELVHRLTWEDFQDPITQSSHIASSYKNLNTEQAQMLTRHLVTQAAIYGRKRGEDIWKVCEGKEVFHAITGSLGLSDDDAAERAIAALWARRPDLVPHELTLLRDYIAVL